MLTKAKPHFLMIIYMLGDLKEIQEEREKEREEERKKEKEKKLHPIFCQLP